MSTRAIAAAAAGVALSLAAGAAEARPWIITVGGRVQAVPPYEGAGHDIILPIPTFRARHAEDPDRPNFADDSMGVAIFHSRWVYLGPVIRLHAKRDNEGERVGLRQVDLAVEPGAQVSIWPTDWLRLHAEARRGVAGHHGWVGDGALDLVARSGRWTATVGPRFGLGVHNYMDAYFGVTPAEAAANPAIAQAYDPGSGVRYVGGLLGLNYRWSNHWEAVANFGYHRLSDRAADSPIVGTFGARDEFSAGAGVRYTFQWSG